MDNNTDYQFFIKALNLNFDPGNQSYGIAGCVALFNTLFFNDQICCST